jgi:hypothetical protein
MLVRVVCGCAADDMGTAARRSAAAADPSRATSEKKVGIGETSGRRGKAPLGRREAAIGRARELGRETAAFAGREDAAGELGYGQSA